MSLALAAQPLMRFLGLAQNMSSLTRAASTATALTSAHLPLASLSPTADRPATSTARNHATTLLRNPTAPQPAHCHSRCPAHGPPNDPLSSALRHNPCHHPAISKGGVASRRRAFSTSIFRSAFGFSSPGPSSTVTTSRASTTCASTVAPRRSFSSASVPARSSRIQFRSSSVNSPQSLLAASCPVICPTTKPISTSRFCATFCGKRHQQPKMSDREILPDAVKPVHYHLSVKDMDFEAWTFQGFVSIDLKITEPTSEVVLNAAELKLKEAQVKLGEDTVTSTEFTYDEEKERVTIKFDKELPASDKTTVAIDYAGIIRDDMAGFYRSRYKSDETAHPATPKDGTQEVLLVTQFEACDARRAFPCFDEPNRKATFDLELEVPEGLTALSNMPEKENKTSTTRDGFRVVSFETSPVMSTYLLSWAIGDLEYEESFTDREYNGKKVPVRVYGTRGLIKNKTEFSLKFAPRVIDLYSEKFGLDYPLPKLDMLTVQEFAQAAMEHWGLITYSPTQVLVDAGETNSNVLNRAAEVIAHELAHQWFGNLVTMDWWDDLWLNEGFATWMSWYAIDHFYPGWKVWEQFVAEGFTRALNIDGLRSSHPIHVPIRNALDVNQIFDAVSYEKGCSIIGMLAAYLGEDNFVRGVGKYLKKHTYKNATTADLWAALSEESGININERMENWIEKVGYPVVTVEETGDDELTIRQERFLSTGDVKPEDDETKWWLPLNIRTNKSSGNAEELAKLATFEKVTKVSGINKDFYLVNSGSHGVYLVNYSVDRIEKISRQLDELTVQDKLGLFASLSGLTNAGKVPTSTLLNLVAGFKGSMETNALIWDVVSASVSRTIRTFNHDDTLVEGLKKFGRDLVGPLATKLGWEYPAGIEYSEILLRQNVIDTAAYFDHPATVLEGLKMFSDHTQDPIANPLTSYTRPTIYRLGARKKPTEALKFAQKEWYHGKNLDSRVTSFGAIASIKDLDLIRETIWPSVLALSPPAEPEDAYPASDLFRVIFKHASEPKISAAFWEFFQENYDALVAKSNNPVVLSRVIQTSLSGFSDMAMIDEIDKFFANKDTKKLYRALDTAKERIRLVASRRARDEDDVRTFLKSHGYL